MSPSKRIGLAASIVLHGITTCDTVRKARAWLDGRGIAYRFHDFRADGLDRARLEAWCDALGWERVLNRASTTFRALSPQERSGLDRDKAVGLMAVHPTLIKRPVLVTDGHIVVGFKPEHYDRVFGGGKAQG